MRAFYKTPASWYALTEISAEEMQTIFDDEMKAEVRGIPVYFDCHERVWPQPPQGSPSVDFEE